MFTKKTCLEKVNGNFELVRNHNYYYQVQQQLFTLKERKFCDFVVCGIDSEKKAHTVLPKFQLPPLVSFLARRVSFLSRRVSFLSIRVSFLARVTEPFSMEYITRERSLYYLLYQRFPFALCCQIGEVEIKTESLFVFSFIVLNLQRLQTSV